MAGLIKPGSLRSLSNWSGCSSNASMPLAIKLTVVSWPATINSKIIDSNSSSSSCSLASFAVMSPLIRSLPRQAAAVLV